MVKKNKPLLTDEFLDELANEINEIYGCSTKEKKDEQPNNDIEKKV